MLDTTMQPKAIAHPTDSRLLNPARDQPADAAQEAGITLCQSYARVGKAAERPTGTTPKMALVDRGYRGVQVSAGKRLLVSHTRRLPKHLKKLLKRRQVVEPTIGHMKKDGLPNRNWFKGALGDAMHAALCGAGHKLRMILAHLRALLFTCVGQVMVVLILVTSAPSASAFMVAR